MTSHLIGVRFGEPSEHAALAVLKRVFTWSSESMMGDPDQLVHEVPWLARWKPGTAYPQIVQEVAEIRQRIEGDLTADGVLLIVDATAAGNAPIAALRRAGAKPREVIVTGAARVSGDGASVMSVPRRDIASALVAESQAGLLKVAAELDHAAELEEQVAGFSYQINRRKPSADYEQMLDQPVDDDLVVAAAIALWWSTAKLSRRYSGAKAAPEVETGRWNPFSYAIVDRE